MSATEPTTEPAYFPGGVEWFTVEDEPDNQCARCGSSVTFLWCSDCQGHDVDCRWCGNSRGHYACLSSDEWCDANPLPGRENVQGARG